MFDFTIPRTDFLTAVERVEKLSPPKATVPILSHVLLSLAEDGTLDVTTTDLQRKGIATTRVESQTGHGAVCVSTAHLATTLKRVSAETVTFSVGEREALFKCGRSKIKMPTLRADDFPDIRDPSFDGSALRMSGSDLGRIISACAFAMATNEVQYNLKGIFWTVEGDKLTAVGTEGHKLAAISIPMPEGTHDMPSCILPDDTVHRLTPFTKCQTVDVTVGKNLIEFESDGYSLTSVLVDGNYPEFRRIIPTNQPYSVRVDREALIASIRRVETFAGGGEREIAMIFTPDTLRLVTASADSGEAEDAMEVDGDADMLIGFKSDMILSSLSSLDCGEVEIRLRDTASPAVFADPSDDDRAVVVGAFRLGHATMQAVKAGAPAMKEAA